MADFLAGLHTPPNGYPNADFYGDIGVCELNTGSTDCMDYPDNYCELPVSCKAGINQLIPNDLSALRAVDPEPSLVWFIDTGIHTIFPDRAADGSDFLWHYDPGA